MEGVGSRLGRASSRYGPSTVFNGPVRRWKKKWVHVSPSNFTNYHNSQSNAHNASRLLLCRWTPISPTTTANGDNTSAKDTNSDEPPRRKFRYTPIAVLEQKKEVAKKVDDEAARTSENNQSTTGPTSRSDDGLYGKSNIDDVSTGETQATDKNWLLPQDSNKSQLDLGLHLEGDDDNHDSDGQNKGGPSGGLSSGGFWTLG